MIKTFRCAETESLFNGARVQRFVNIEAVACRAAQHPRERSVPRVLSLE